MQQSTCFSLLEQAVSTARLQRYGAGAAPDNLVAARYFWNIALCESLYPSLHTFEIALRNAIHNAATAKYGTDQWFTSRRPNGDSLLLEHEWDQFDIARQRIHQAGNPVTTGRVVADMSLGFWTALFRAPYEFDFAVPIAPSVFPGASKRERARANIEPRLDAIRDLRNRVFHYGPIWDRPLVQEHAEIIQTIGWINPLLHAMMPMNDRFADKLTKGTAPFEQGYAAFLATLPP